MIATKEIGRSGLLFAHLLSLLKSEGECGSLPEVVACVICSVHYFVLHDHNLACIIFSRDVCLVM